MIEPELGRVFVDAFVLCVAGFLTVAGTRMTRHVRQTNQAVVPHNGSPALLERVTHIENTQTDVLTEVRAMTLSARRVETHLEAYERDNALRHDRAERRLDDLQSQVAVLIERRRQDDEAALRYKGPRRRKGEA